MFDPLIPSRRGLPGQDPIFALNAEAQRRREAGDPVLNATVGALLDDDGRMVVLETVQAAWRELTPAEVFPYAPIAGDPAFLDALTARHWPGLAAGTGCATPGGSGALALSVRNLLEPGMRVLAAGPVWGPYHVLCTENGAGLETAPFPAPGAALDLDAWRTRAEALVAAQGRLLVWLNEPCHNPTGRHLGEADRAALIDLLRELAGRAPVTLLLDCAYVDYAADPEAVRRALDAYGQLGAEGRVLVGAALSLSKALTLYGGRGGALVFPWRRDPDLQAALGASCRGLFSNCPRAPQAVFLRLAGDPGRLAALRAEHRRWAGVLGARAQALAAALAAEGLEPVHWQGGFFAALPAPDGQGERLQARGVYAVPVPGALRIGLCGLAERHAPVFAAAWKDALIRH